MSEYWLVGSMMGEYVKYYNPTGNVMHFTNERESAARAADYEQARQWQRVANQIYKRNFKFWCIVE